MRPRFVINKGIGKKITAVSSYFTVGSTYEAAIYNRHDMTVKILDQAVCALNERTNKNECAFQFTGTETNKLKEGYATIEIYDSSKSMMIFRDEFAVIRKNSLPIQSDESE